MSEFSIDTSTEPYKKDCESLDEIIANVTPSLEALSVLSIENQKVLFDSDERLRKCVRLAQILEPALTRFQSEV